MRNDEKGSRKSFGCDAERHRERVTGVEVGGEMTPSVKLKPYISQIRGMTYKPDEIADAPFENSVPLLKANNITDDGLDDSSLIYIDSNRIKPEQFIRAGDLLLAASSGSKKVIGKSAHFTESFGGSFGAFCKVVRPKNGLYSDYLKHFFKTSYYRSSIEKAVQGANINNLRNEHLDGLEIPLPPLDDQIRIAHLLGKVEGLIAQRKQHLQQLDNLLKSVFLEMFGPSSPGYNTWPLEEVRDLAAKHKGAMRTGPFGSNLLHSEFAAEGDVAVLGIDNAVQNRFAWDERRFITNEKYRELDSYRVYPGDVIVTIMGTIGRSAVVPSNIPLAINTKHLAAITLNREITNPLFLSYSIHSSPFILNQFKSKNRGAIMSGLNLEIIKETKLKRPPIELQNKFAETHTSVDELKAMYQQSLTDLETLYGTLSQQAFKGELDLSRIILTTEDTDSTEVADHEIYERHETWISEPCSAYIETPTSESHA